MYWMSSFWVPDFVHAHMMSSVLRINPRAGGPLVCLGKSGPGEKECYAALRTCFQRSRHAALEKVLSRDPRPHTLTSGPLFALGCRIVYDTVPIQSIAAQAVKGAKYTT